MTQTTSTPTIELPQQISGLKLDELISCSKIEPTSTSKFNEVELDSLDEQIALKLNQLKQQSSLFSKDGTDSSQSNWVLRQEENLTTNDPQTSPSSKRRWLVARSIENDVELSIDVRQLLCFTSLLPPSSIIHS